MRSLNSTFRGLALSLQLRFQRAQLRLRILRLRGNVLSHLLASHLSTTRSDPSAKSETESTFPLKPIALLTIRLRVLGFLLALVIGFTFIQMLVVRCLLTAARAICTLWSSYASICRIFKETAPQVWTGRVSNGAAKNASGEANHFPKNHQAKEVHRWSKPEHTSIPGWTDRVRGTRRRNASPYRFPHKPLGSSELQRDHYIVPRGK